MKNLRHNIDLNAPGGLDRLFAANRALFGDATMRTNPDAPADQQDPQPNPTPTPTPTPTPSTTDEAALGDAGKRALQAIREERDAATRELATLRQEKEERERAEMSDLEKARTDAQKASERAAKLELDNIRLQAIADYNVPKDYQSLVTGTDAATFAANAEKVAKLAAGTVTTTTTVDPIPGSGNREQQGAGGGGNTGGSMQSGAERYTARKK